MDSCLFLILRVIWFVCIGLPLGWFCIQAGWLLMLTIIGIPLSLWIFNQIPLIMTLRMSSAEEYRLGLRENEMVQGTGQQQLPLVLRIIWFVFVGWWFSLLWINVAYFLSAIIITLPAGFWMFNRLPFVTFLTRY